jgi:hypothetical protein
MKKQMGKNVGKKGREYLHPFFSITHVLAVPAAKFFKETNYLKLQEDLDMEF